MKTCREIQQEIDDLRRILKSDIEERKRTADLSTREYCYSVSPYVMCDKCICWKSKGLYNEASLEGNKKS